MADAGVKVSSSILALDPGNEETAWLVYDPAAGLWAPAPAGCCGARDCRIMRIILT